MTFGEGDTALLAVKVARGNDEQALLEINSMEGPYSLRVPQSELRPEPLDIEEYRADLERRVKALDGLAESTAVQATEAYVRGRDELGRAYTMSEIVRRSKSAGLQIAMGLLPPKPEGDL